MRGSEWRTFSHLRVPVFDYDFVRKALWRKLLVAWWQRDWWRLATPRFVPLMARLSPMHISLSNASSLNLLILPLLTPLGKLPMRMALWFTLPVVFCLSKRLP